MSKISKLNTFVFLSSFVRGMVEYFIPIFLINKHYSIKEVFLFFAVHYLIMFILNKFFMYVAKKISFKWMLILNAFFFVLNYYFLTTISHSFINLIIAAIIFSFYFHTYWSGRLYYSVDLLDKNKLAKEIGYLIIYSQLALIPSTYAGALLIENTSLLVTLIVLTALSIISIIPLFYLKPSEEKQKLLSLQENFKKLNLADLLYMIVDQFRMITIYMFPLFLYVNIKNSLSYIGIFNVLVGVSSVIFIFIFSKKLDKSKKNYIKESVIMLAAIWLIKINVISSIIILVIGFFEGLATRATENTISKVIFEAAYKIGSLNFVSIYLFIQNFIRFLVFLIAYLLMDSLEILLYVSTIGTILIAVIPSIGKKRNSQLPNYN